MDLETRIEQLKAQIAEKEAYQKKLANEYSNPYSKYHYGHIFDAIAGNSSGLDKEAAEEAAYQKMMMEQAQADKIRAEQAYNTAYENELNRVNARDIASRTNSGYGSTDETSKLMREIEFAQAEYEAAKDNLELGNPTSEANYKKAASKYNYWIKQLPKEFEGYSPFSLDVNEVGTSPRIKAQREEEAHNNNVGDLKILMDSELNGTEWTNANVRKIEEYLGKLDPEKDKVVLAEYRNKVRDKGDTKETKNRNYMTTLRNFAKSYNAVGNEEQSELQKEKPKLYKDAKAKGLIK